MRLRWSTKALDERERILRHIAKDSLEAAFRVDQRIEREAESLVIFPYLGRRSLSGKFRVLPVRGTDYVIAYRIDGEIVDISVVFHGAREFSHKI